MIGVPVIEVPVIEVALFRVYTAAQLLRVPVLFDT